jgi:hypothetical protein
MAEDNLLHGSFLLLKSCYRLGCSYCENAVAEVLYHMMRHELSVTPMLPRPLWERGEL